MTGIRFNFSDIPADKQLIVAWYSHDAPTVEVNRQAFTPGAGEKTLVPNGVGNGVYDFKFFESSDGITLETLLTIWPIDGSYLNGRTVVDVYDYVVGRGSGSAVSPKWNDPNAGEVTINDERLAAKKYFVFRAVEGKRSDDSYSVIPTGGFSLYNPEIFEDGDLWWVMVMDTQPAQNTAVSGGGITGIHKVPANDTFGAAYYNTNNVAESGAVILTTSFNDFALIPDNTTARFSTYSGAQRYWTLYFGAASIFFHGKLRNWIHLAPCEMIEITWKGGVGYITADHTRYHLAGETFMADNKSMLGTALCDGSGIEQNVADYIRMIEELPLEMRVSYSDWEAPSLQTISGNAITYYPNKARFAINADGTKFKFPDPRNFTYKILRNYSGGDSEWLSNGASGVQTQQLLKHRHVDPNATPTKRGGKGDPNNNAKRTPNGDAFGDPYEDATAFEGDNANRVDALGKYGLAYL